MQSRKSPAGGRSQLHADPKHTDLGGFATRKRMLTLDYLTSQSENHSWAESPSLSLKSILSLEHELPLLLAQPCKTSCTFLHHHPVSGDWLYCPRVRGPRFASVTTYLVRESGSERFKSFFKAHTKLVSVRSQTGTPSLWRVRDWMPHCSPRCLPALEGFQT